MLSKEFFLNPPKNTRLSPVVRNFVIFAEIVMLAKRLDVGYIATATLADWYHMIWLQVRSFATRITAMVIVLSAKGFPFLSRETSPCSSLLGSSYIKIFRRFTRIGRKPPSVIFASLVSILCPIPLVVCRTLFFVPRIISAGIFVSSLSVLLLPSNGAGQHTLFAVPPFVPFTRTTLGARQSIGFSHEKSPFALVAREALKYTLLATSAYNTCRHALGTLARSPGFSFFNFPIIPQVVR